MKIHIKPRHVRRDTFIERCQPCQSAGDIIKTATVKPGVQNTLLRSMSAPQLETSEPLPIFSRNIEHGESRFTAAKAAAEAAAKAAESSTTERA